MRQFQCDYLTGCHPLVLRALTESNDEEEPGYGEDRYCREASELIRAACEHPDLMVRFVCGGTLANLTVISAALLPHQAVVAPDCAHIAQHETGAIEATGHKIIVVPHVDGRIRPADLRRVCQDYVDCPEQFAVVQPGLLYISHPSELGTLYTLAELEELAGICHQYGLFFYVDGARLAYGLAASPEVDLPALARLTDAFCIGGTKCGALSCEAIALANRGLQRHFPPLMRQRGATLSKARLGGVQFRALFTDGLYQSLGKRAVEAARRLRQAFAAAGFEPVGSSATNQQFVAMSAEQARAFAARYRYEPWGQDERGREVLRFCTSWSTTEEAVRELLEDIDRIGRLGREGRGS